MKYMIMPKVGEALSQVTVVKWLKKEGDKVEQGEGICEVITDKATLEIDSPFTGTVTRIIAREGAEIGVGENMAAISENGETPS